MQAHALVGLDLDVQPVGRGDALGAGEHRVRRLLEDHHDLGGPAVHPLAGAQVERHPGPAPVLHLGLERDERLGAAPPWPRSSEYDGTATPSTSPAPYRPRTVSRSTSAGVIGSQRLEHLELLVADGLATDVRRRLHRDQAEQLEQVVLHHVAQRAGVVVVVAAAADADGLGDGDLDVVDPARVPQRLEEGVGEAGDEEVLDALLAEVVVDPEDLRLVEDPADGVVDGAGGGEVVADRLLDDDAGVLVDDADLVEALADRAEQLRGDREVEDPHGLVGCGRSLSSAWKRCQSSGTSASSIRWCSRAEEPVDGAVVQVGGVDVDVVSAARTSARQPASSRSERETPRIR